MPKPVPKSPEEPGLDEAQNRALEINTALMQATREQHPISGRLAILIIAAGFNDNNVRRTLEQNHYFFYRLHVKTMEEALPAEFDRRLRKILEFLKIEVTNPTTPDPSHSIFQ